MQQAHRIPLPESSLSTPPYVVSDIAPLRRVVVNSPSPTDYHLEVATGNFLHYNPPPEDAARQHAEFERLLRAAGAEVLSIEQLLDEAIEAARASGQFTTWLRAALPRLASLADTVTGATLLTRTAQVQFQTDAEGVYRHIVDHRLGLAFTRDVAVMTPRGLVLGNFVSPSRRSEALLMRFATQFAPSLRDYPVVFDGAEEGLFLVGGDLQVVDEHTLMIGVGHFTDPRVAPRLAKRLGMDVIAVQMRKSEVARWKPDYDLLMHLFLHLDTCFTRVDDKLAVALPYFLEAEYADNDPLTRFLKGLVLEPTVDMEQARAAIACLADIGWVRRFRAGSGEEDLSIGKLKLVDLVRQWGWQVSFVGGSPDGLDMEHFFRVVLAEHHKQAANLVATAPGKVLAYEGASRTKAALEACGAKVQAFNGRDLWPWWGGPHCLTLPLERG
ncbi:arginine deiminase family protein [Dyella subtropica]|uniref:arginine deiminase family protein n=1 Tax=Dyella subtropica TaxID=2992127 RepID=UPI00225204F2|nr:arginine deiminase family protein [Dyella subtropica]